MQPSSRFNKKLATVITEVSHSVYPSGKCVRELWVYALFFLLVPVVVVIKLIRPVIFIRWGPLYAERVGHFVANTAYFLLEKKANKERAMPKHVDIFYLPRANQISNQYLALIWRRSILIVPRLLGLTLRAVEGSLFGWEKHYRGIPGPVLHEPGITIQNDRDVYGLLDRYPPQLHLERKEYSYGRELLEQMGVGPRDKYVCLIVRDSAYYEATFGAGSDITLSNLRNADVEDYKSAIDYLTNQGYFVFRMGRHVNSPLHSKNNKVIDYATSAARSDFLDVYLGATCEFCISSGTGFEQIPLIFKKRMVWTNFSPIDCFFSHNSRFLTIFKHYFSPLLGRNLHLSEIVETALIGQSLDITLDAKNIVLIPNSPNEILAVVEEALAHHEGKWVASVDDAKRQERFRQIFPANLISRIHSNEEPLHGTMHGRIGATFLEQNPGWYT